MHPLNGTGRSGENDVHVVLSSDMSPTFREADSSSSSSSSDKDCLQLKTGEFGIPPTVNPEIHVGCSRLPSASMTDAPCVSSDLLGRHDETSQAGISDNSSLHLAKQSPSTQAMVRSKGPDDCRIPSSIFERTKSTAPVEWSVASNESLFSIHAGNSSFSRDYLFLSGMSGELPNFSISPGPQAPGDDLRAAAKTEAMKDVPGAAAIGHIDGSKLPVESNRHSASTSCHSIASNQSFAFPVFAEARSGSVKVERTQHQQQQKKPAEPEESSSSSPAVALGAQQKSWFSCFCCGFYR